MNKLLIVIIIVATVQSVIMYKQDEVIKSQRAYISEVTAELNGIYEIVERGMEK